MRTLIYNIFQKLLLAYGNLNHRSIIGHVVKGRRCLEGRIIGGAYDGQLRLLPRIQLTTNEGEEEVYAEFSFYPIYQWIHSRL